MPHDAPHNRLNEDLPLAEQILVQIEQLVLKANEKSQPLEMSPYREQLFEFFVTAEGAGYLDDEEEGELLADELCKQLGVRWGLADAALQSTASQSRLSGEALVKMRLLWSLMRMWMEWTYAWKRYPEFHGGISNTPSDETGENPDDAS